MPKKSQEFNKVAECLYRNGNRLYHALVKVNGKQTRRSLKTTDLAIAKRRLVEFRAKAERLKGEENRNIRFEELADEWLASIKSGLKPKSYDRRCVALVGLTPFFRGIAVKATGFAEIDAWKRKRGATVLRADYSATMAEKMSSEAFDGPRVLPLESGAKAA